MAVALAVETANAAADAVAAQCDGGALRIYGGERPLNAETTPGLAPLLAELPMAAPSAPAAICAS